MLDLVLRFHQRVCRLDFELVSELGELRVLRLGLLRLEEVRL